MCKNINIGFDNIDIRPTITCIMYVGQLGIHPPLQSTTCIHNVNTKPFRQLNTKRSNTRHLADMFALFSTTFSARKHNTPPNKLHTELNISDPYKINIPGLKRWINILIKSFTFLIKHSTGHTVRSSSSALRATTLTLNI